MSETVLSAEQHFESLREAVWARFCARHRGADRDRFDDLYSEWWTRELERSAQGRPSRAEAPAAFVAEAVHRVLIDDARARARGLSRDDKGTLEIVDLEGQLAAAGVADTAAQASYEALAHRVLTLVQGRLTDRELRVFVWSYLYLRSSEATASALGLSLPRVKKDRRKIATKVGQEVWSVLSGELELCAAYEDKRLGAVFEILTVHVEDCPKCRAALGGVRRGALAVLGPEMLAVAGVSEGATHVLSDLVHSAVMRINGLVHRGTEAFTAAPPNGRAAAAVAVAATAVAGGAATISPHADRQAPPKRERAARAQAPKPRAVAPAEPSPSATQRRVPTLVAKREPTPAAPARNEAKAARTPAPTATPAREPVTFEQQAPSPAAPPAATPVSGDAPASDPPPSEFGFEHD